VHILGKNHKKLLIFNCFQLTTWICHRVQTIPLRVLEMYVLEEKTSKVLVPIVKSKVAFENTVEGFR
jgi:hypothetical protein